MPRRSLMGEVLAPRLPATATELAAGAIGPGQLRVITSIMGQIPSTADPQTVEVVEQTLASSARRFDPAALSRIGERLLAYLDPDGPEPSEQPEQTRELRVRTASGLRPPAPLLPRPPPHIVAGWRTDEIRQSVPAV